MNTTVLVIDDDLMSLRLAELFLSKAGYQVEKADNGLDGLRRLERGDVDLLLLDVEMPEMGGVEVLTEIRQRQLAPDMPILFLSGSETMEEEIRMGAYSVEGLIKKPFVPSALLQQVQEVLKRS